MSPATAKHRNGTPEKTGEKYQGKEWKSCIRVSAAGAGMLANAYNPVSGTFHMLDSSIPDPGVSNQVGRFRSIDETDDVASATGSYSEYDSMSNNGSCSGESEDQAQLSSKDKKSGTPPGVVGGSSDKRDKIRYRNEKKHQRQKERRAQELRDRCTGYLMSRKLEGLAQQLIAMGFSSDRATMSLILNEGHVERSVAWILEGGEGQVKEDWNAEGNLKIDISEELARIADLEIRLKYPRAEIERAIVLMEGDLSKAFEWLREKYPLKSPTAAEYSFGSQELSKEPTQSLSDSLPYMISGQGRGSGLFHALNYQRRDEEESHPAQSRILVNNTTSGPLCNIEGARALSKAIQHPGTDWQRLSCNVDGRPPSTTSRNPACTSQSPPNSLPAPVRNAQDVRTSLSGLSMRRELPLSHLTPRGFTLIPQMSPSPVIPPPPSRSASTSPSLSPNKWHGNVPGSTSPSSVLYFSTMPPGDILFQGSSKNLVPGETFGEDSEERHVHQTNQLDAHSEVWGNSSKNAFSSVDTPMSSPNTPSGITTGWGSGLSGGSLDWSMWVSGGIDYKTIDWSVAASPSNSSEGSVWGISSSLASMLNLSDGGKPRLGLVSEGTSYGTTGHNLSTDPWIMSDRGSPGSFGQQEQLPRESGGSAMGLGVPEWTSPFTGKDLFTLPHQTVSFPSL